MGVQATRLGADGLDHPWMTMADRGDVVVGVQIAPAGLVVQPDTFAAHGVQRTFVEQAVGRAQQALAALDELSFLFAEALRIGIAESVDHAHASGSSWQARAICACA
ncbi:hypothetical protein D3C80_1543300 [compost metagenome]